MISYVVPTGLGNSLRNNFDELNEIRVSDTFYLAPLYVVKECKQNTGLE